MTSTLLATKTFTTGLVREGSWGATALGEHQSTMDLYATHDPDYYYIEWDIPSIETVEGIGIWVDPKTKALTGYDGVMSLPHEAIELLESAGFTVGEDFK